MPLREQDYQALWEKTSSESATMLHSYHHDGLMDLDGGPGSPQREWM